MPFLAASAVVLGLAAVTADDSPAGDVPWWLILVLALASVFCGWMHTRWRAGRPFTSRFTTLEREQAKMLLYGYTLLPNCFGIAAMALALGLNKVIAPTNPATALLFLLLILAFFAGGVWSAKEWWRPTERRTPDWVREQFPDWRRDRRDW